MVKNKTAKKLKRKEDANQAWLAKSREERVNAIGEALGQRTYYHKLGASMATCGTTKNGNKTNCRSPYCMRCGGDMIKAQQAKIATALTKYPTDTERRDNLKHLTILFAIYPFDTSGSFPVFPTATALDALTDAKRMLKNMANVSRFKKLLRWRGAFSWEPIQLSLRTDKKKRTDDALINASSDYQPDTVITGSWSDHRILFHAHLVVDLNGVDRDDFAQYCHDRWGNDKKVNQVPDGAQLDSLYHYMPISESMTHLGKYPLRSKFDYNEDYKTPFEPEVLALMCDGLTQLNKRGQHGVILSQKGWA